METYTALMVDLEKSRHYGASERKQIQDRLIRCIGFLNRLYKTAIVLEVEFSAGDEFQGLFRSPAAAYLFYRSLDTLIAPVRTRAGIGTGEWTLRIPDGRSAEQDGTAYHLARHALEWTQDGAGRVCFLSGSDEDVFINEFLSIEQGMLGGLSDKQRLLLLLSEVMVPVLRADDMDIAVYPEIFGLVENSQIFIKDSEKINFEKIRLLEWITTDKITINGRLLCFRKHRGLPGELAAITGETRQNMANIIKAGDLYGLRDLQLVILRWLHAYARGDAP